MIEKFKNLHSSKHCFIISSGPSLNDLNLEPLTRRLTFGLNRSFLTHEKSYYHSAFDLRLFDLYPEQLRNSRYLFTLEDRPFGIPLHLLGVKGWSWNLEKGIYSGYTISYFALQLAVYMGFKEIYFLGLDLLNNKENTHFFGTDFHSIDHDSTEFPKMRKSFEDVAPMLKEAGVNIYNCSPVSTLTCFPYVDYKKAIL
jgi:predicted peroxiredoxin